MPGKAAAGVHTAPPHTVHDYNHALLHTSLMIVLASIGLRLLSKQQAKQKRPFETFKMTSFGFSCFNLI